MAVIVDLLVHDSDFPLARRLTETFEREPTIESVVCADEVRFLLSGTRKEAPPRPSGADDLFPELTYLADSERGALYLGRWSPSPDGLLTALLAFAKDVGRMGGESGIWRVRTTFASVDPLDDFLTHCREDGLAVRVDRRFGASPQDSGPWFGVTPPQRHALCLASEQGYYDIPRRVSTADIADQLGISDQAVTERLRRGIRTLVSNTLRPVGAEKASPVPFGD